MATKERIAIAFAIVVVVVLFGVLIFGVMEKGFP